MGKQEVRVSAKGLCRDPTSSLVEQVKDSNSGWGLIQSLHPSEVASFKGPAFARTLLKHTSCSLNGTVMALLYLLRYTASLTLLRYCW